MCYVALPGEGEGHMCYVALPGEGEGHMCDVALPGEGEGHMCDVALPGEGEGHMCDVALPGEGEGHMCDVAYLVRGRGTCDVALPGEGEGHMCDVALPGEGEGHMCDNDTKFPQPPSINCIKRERACITCCFRSQEHTLVCCVCMCSGHLPPLPVTTSGCMSKDDPVGVARRKRCMQCGKRMGLASTYSCRYVCVCMCLYVLVMWCIIINFVAVLVSPCLWSSL